MRDILKKEMDNLKHLQHKHRKLLGEKEKAEEEISMAVSKWQEASTKKKRLKSLYKELSRTSIFFCLFRQTNERILNKKIEGWWEETKVQITEAVKQRKWGLRDERDDVEGKSDKQDNDKESIIFTDKQDNEGKKHLRVQRR